MRADSDREPEGGERETRREEQCLGKRETETLRSKKIRERKAESLSGETI